MLRYARNDVIPTWSDYQQGEWWKLPTIFRQKPILPICFAKPGDGLATQGNCFLPQGDHRYFLSNRFAPQGFLYYPQGNGFTPQRDHRFYLRDCFGPQGNLYGPPGDYSDYPGKNSCPRGDF